MYTVYNHPLTGIITAIPAKAHGHRALMAAALSDSPSTLQLTSISEDLDATMTSLRHLGCSIDYQNGVVTVTPGSAPAEGGILPGESGTTLRLLLPIAASLCQTVHVDAKGRLPDRPLEPLLSEMKAHGITVSQEKPPFIMRGSLQPGTFTMVGNVSSQFFSGLLLAGPLLGGITVQSTGPIESMDYITLTMRTMEDFGIVVEHTIDGGNNSHIFVVPSGTYQYRKDYAIEGDWSNGATWLIAGALQGTPITVHNLQPSSVQPDKAVLSILEQAGATIAVDGTNISISGEITQPITVDLGPTPDLLPVLSIVAAKACGTSRFVNGSRLRLKESDRLVAVAQMIADLGGVARIIGDDLIVEGTGRLMGGVVDSHHDHRLVMAGALAGLISDSPVIINDSHAINKSYPAFFEHWTALGGMCHVI